MPTAGLNKLGFIVNSIDQSQLGYYLVDELNKWVGPQKDAIVFSENISVPLLHPKFALMNVCEILSFRGPLIATTVSTARKLIAGSTTKDRFFYVWDLEFLRGQRRDYLYNLEVFQSPRLKLICRNDDHRRVIENAFNVEVIGCADNFNLAELIPILQG